MVKTPTRTARQAVKIFLAEREQTQRWLADKLDVHETFLSDVLLGRRPVPEALAKNFKALSGIDLRDFDRMAS